jgi:hypothetical protein
MADLDLHTFEGIRLPPSVAPAAAAPGPHFRAGPAARVGPCAPWAGLVAHVRPPAADRRAGAVSSPAAGPKPATLSAGVRRGMTGHQLAAAGGDGAVSRLWWRPWTRRAGDPPGNLHLRVCRLGAERGRSLERAALRGVLVRLVIDGVGTPRMPAEWRERFAKAGVRWRVYAPLGRSGLAHAQQLAAPAPQAVCGRRHRRISVVASTSSTTRTMWCWGVWRTLGWISRCGWPGRWCGMVETMEQLWWRLQAVRKARQREFVAAWEALRATSPVGDFSRHACENRGATGAQDPAGLSPSGCAAAGRRWRPRRPAAARQREPPARHRACLPQGHWRSAREIVIANAYFIPGASCAGAVDGRAAWCAGAPAAAGQVRALSPVPRGAPGVPPLLKPVLKSTNTRPAPCTPRWPWSTSAGPRWARPTWIRCRCCWRERPM